MYRSVDWAERLSEVTPVAAFAAEGPLWPDPPVGRVPADVVALLRKLTGGSPVGAVLAATAALKVVLARTHGAARAAVVLPGVDRAGEFALCAPVDTERPARELLRDLHAECETAARAPWPDRAALAALLPDGSVLGRLGLWFEDLHRDFGFDGPLEIVLRFRGDPASDDLLVTVESAAGPVPAAAWSLATGTAAALAALVRRPRDPVAELDVLGAQRTALLAASGLPVPAALPAVTVVGLLDEAAHRHGDRLAVGDDVRKLTHHALTELATAAAGRLTAELGLRRGDRVALLLDRGTAQVAAMMAVLRASACYVPLDPAHPAERNRLLLELSGCVAVIHDGTTVPLPAGVRSVGVDDLLTAGAAPAPVPPRPEDAAVLFFTSGSTGTPKPVLVRHDQLAHKARTAARATGIDHETVGALVSAISSDQTAYQIFVSLVAGGSVVTAGRPDALDPREFWTRVEQLGITFINCVPSLLAAVLDALPEAPPGRRRRVRHLFLGGDAVPRGLLARALARLDIGTFGNMYGPTEATMECVSLVCPGSALDSAQAVPIGSPSPGYGVLVVGPDDELVPAGVPGELIIVGPFVADGYAGDAAATAERFRPHPLAPGAPAFRTGDFVRRRPDGRIDFLGRRDAQIKIRGNRVETGEVEHALAAVPGVAAVAVAPRRQPDGAVALVAGYVPAPDAGDGGPTPERVLEALVAALPPYMVPSSLVRLTAIPTTPHGKLNVPALLAAAESAGPRWRPEDRAGRIVARAWEDVLGRPPSGPGEDFFAAGGHSLAASRLTARLCEVADADCVTLRSVLAARTAAQLAEAVAAGVAAPPRQAPVTTGDRRPASHAQRRMWFLDRAADEDLRVYQMVEAFRWDVPLAAGRLRHAVERVVRRHSALRTVLELDGDQLWQRVLPAGAHPVPLQVVDVTAADADAALAELVRTEQHRRSDLATGPLFRAFWLDEGDGHGVLVLSVHHAVCDGWSIAVLLRDIGAELGLPGVSAPPDAAVLQYADHSDRLGHRLREQTPAHRDFWRRTLAGVPRPDLPLDRPRPATRSSAGGAVRVPLPQAQVDALLRLCGEAGTTAFTGFVAISRVLLRQLCASGDVPLGTVTAGRSERAHADAVGLFVNTIVLRTPVAPEMSFLDVLAAARETALAAAGHDEYPFDEVVADQRTARVAGRNPLFDVLVEQVFAGTATAGPGGGVRPVPLEPAIADFDLVLGFDCPQRPGEPAELWAGFRSDVFDRRSVEGFAEQFAWLLDRCTTAPGTPVGAVATLPPARLRALLDQAATPPLDDGTETTLPALFAEQVRRNPEAVALECGGTRLTYAELDHRAAATAARLAGVAAVGRDRVIGVRAERVADTVVAVLAVLRSGSAFLPLDPALPAARTAHLLTAAGATALLSTTGADPRLRGSWTGPVLRPAGAPADGPAGDPPSPRDLAYVAFTSGSAGAPKGVLVEHRGIVNTVRFRAAHYGLGPGSVVFGVSPIHFDTGISDVFSALTTGARYVLPSRDQILDPPLFAAEAERTGVTHMVLVPSLYETLLDALRPGAVRQVVLAGEPLPPALAARHAEVLPGTELHNEYGPTEDSVCTTVARVRPGTGAVPIGRPVAGKFADLLDADGRIVPAGVPGELYVGGAGLARGYLGDPALTGRRFVPHPARPGRTAYRTGDLARRLPDGSLRFLGRCDDQVKIRGQRVEPGEVAAVLGELPGVRQAAVVVVPGPRNEPALAGFVVASPDVDAAAARAFLADRLPAAFVPARFVRLDAFPLTTNGKLDRRALAELLPAADDGETPGDTGRSEREREVARVFAATLGCAEPGRGTSLFDLGGHSLSAVRIAAELGERAGYRVPVRAVFEHQTPAALAAWLERRGTPSGPAAVPAAAGPAAPGTGPFPLSHTQRQVWFTSRTSPAAMVIVDSVVPGERLDPRRLERAADEVLEHHEVLRSRIRPDGAALVHDVVGRWPDPVVVVAEPGGDPAAVRRETAAARRAVRDPATGPLVQFRLLPGAAEDGTDVLLFAAHHIVCDAVAMAVVIDELFQRYRGAPDERVSGLGNRDWVAAEQEWLAGPDAAEAVEFWRRTLAGVPEQPALEPSGGHRAAGRGPAGVHQRTVTVAPRGGFAALVAAFATVLHRRTGATDLVLGCPVSLRTTPGLERTVGSLVNAVPLRLAFDGSATVGELGDQARRVLSDALDHARLPFDVLLRHAGPRGRRAGGLFRMGVSWEDLDPRTCRGGVRLRIDERPPEDVEATNDLWLFARSREAGLLLELAYDTARVDHSVAAGIADEVVAVLADQVTDAGRPIAAPGTGSPLADQGEHRP